MITKLWRRLFGWPRFTRRELAQWGLPVVLILAVMLTGCKTNSSGAPIVPGMNETQLMPPAVIPRVAAIVKALVPQSRVITLTWTPNYLVTNEVTVIVATGDLTEPRAAWTPVFSGRTNTWRTNVTGPQLFFTAYNYLP